jgi:hypothetical protein
MRFEFYDQEKPIGKYTFCELCDQKEIAFIWHCDNNNKFYCLDCLNIVKQEKKECEKCKKTEHPILKITK